MRTAEINSKIIRRENENDNVNNFISKQDIDKSLEK